MLIELTDRVVEIDIENIKEVRKNSVWEDGFNEYYVTIYYKDNSNLKIYCGCCSNKNQNENYNRIISKLNINEKKELDMASHAKNISYINDKLQEWCESTGKVERNSSDYYSLLSMLYEIYDLGLDSKEE